MIAGEKKRRRLTLADDLTAISLQPTVTRRAVTLPHPVSRDGAVVLTGISRMQGVAFTPPERPGPARPHQIAVWYARTYLESPPRGHALTGCVGNRFILTARKVNAQRDNSRR